METIYLRKQDVPHAAYVGSLHLKNSQNTRYDMGLPLRMNNLHAPTIPSGPSSVPTPQNGTGLTLKELETKKDNMEAELRALSGVLESVR